jgi:radical SAM superfamily enzyme YgiQ (UPF0313 family)
MKTTEKYDILLIAPKINFHDFRPPLSLIYLASYLLSRGLSCKIIDGNCHDFTPEEIVDEIAEARSIGISCYQTTINETLSLCDEVRRRLPGIKIIGGGPLMTTSHDQLMRLGKIDIGVIGEGELTLCELLQSDLSSVHTVAGIAYRKNGETILTPKRPHIPNLDSLPYLDYSLVDMDIYWKNQSEMEIPKSVFITTSRGCAYQCSFCSTATLWPGKIRRYSVGRIVKEISRLRAIYKDVNISFMDDSFFADKKWLSSFFQKIAPMSLTYGCIGRADHLNEDMVAQLKHTGCRYVGIGVETGVQSRQKKLKKHLDLTKVELSVAWLGRYAILTKCYFMLGFPDETVEEMAETINFAVKLKRLGMSDCTIFAVNLFAGTELSRHYEEALWQSKVYDGQGHKKLSIYSSIPDVSLNPYVSRQQLLALIKLAYEKIEAIAEISPAEIVTLVQRNGDLHDGSDTHVKSD